MLLLANTLQINYTKYCSIKCLLIEVLSVRILKKTTKAGLSDCLVSELKIVLIPSESTLFRYNPIG